MLVRKRKRISEICVLAGCFLVVFLTISQILAFTHRARTNEPARMFSTRELMGEHLIGHTGFQKQLSLIKHTPISGISVQARVRARAKANQEIRELEKSLARLMRENSMTPEESSAKIYNEIYARRVNEIIRTAHLAGMVPSSEDGPSVLWSPSQLSNITDTYISELSVHNDLQDETNPSQTLPYLNDRYEPSWVYERVSGISENVATNDKKQASVQYDKDHDRSEDYDLKNSAARAPNFQERNASTEFGSFGRTELQRFKGQDIGKNESVLKPGVCPTVPSTLVGNSTEVNLNLTLHIDDIIKNNSDVSDGGEWLPQECISRHRVAIIIPYRDRWNHLKVLLHYLIPMLQRQQIHFRIFIVEQFGNETFNKGSIMNAAFREALKLFDFHCVTFHDVDLVPEDDRNMYSCTEQPKHMSIGIDKFEYLLPYEGLVGGVLMFKTEHYQLVNGYSNMYWGWGAEDDDMGARILHNRLRIYRPPSNVARYKMVKHDGRRSSEVGVRMKLLRTAARRSRLEGLNNVKYKLLSTHLEKLFTHFIVDIGQP